MIESYFIIYCNQTECPCLVSHLTNCFAKVGREPPYIPGLLPCYLGHYCVLNSFATSSLSLERKYIADVLLLLCVQPDLQQLSVSFRYCCSFADLRCLRAMLCNRRKAKAS